MKTPKFDASLHRGTCNGGTMMDEFEFEGSLLLEKLAALNLVDEFYAAVDSDDLSEVVSLLRDAEVDEETIAIVIKKIQD